MPPGEFHSERLDALAAQTPGVEDPVTVEAFYQAVNATGLV
jgi:hypothetical protein